MEYQAFNGWKIEKSSPKSDENSKMNVRTNASLSHSNTRNLSKKKETNLFSSKKKKRIVSNKKPFNVYYTYSVNSKRNGISMRQNDSSFQFVLF